MDSTVSVKQAGDIIFSMMKGIKHRAYLGMKTIHEAELYNLKTVRINAGSF